MCYEYDVCMLYMLNASFSASPAMNVNMHVPPVVKTVGPF